MTYDIKFVGNQYTNSSSRDGHIPCLIVDHISAGTWGSLLDWFTNPTNKGSSSTFGVSKKGEIVQFVRIEDMAWANGIGAEDIAASKTGIVKEHIGINPNKYSISIEHEGMDGNLTEEQFQATLWLHKYIRDYVMNKWGYEFGLTSYDVIGHFQVSPYKPECPGKLFPWSRLYTELEDKEYIMKVEDANKIIERWLADEYNLASDDDKDERHRLANELRLASGQAEQ
jgi:N-acetylmuramoyl-L-alanine amidase